MDDRCAMLKIEVLVNKILYQENVIDKGKYDRTAKKLDKLLLEETKKAKNIF